MSRSFSPPARMDPRFGTVGPLEWSPCRAHHAPGERRSNPDGGPTEDLMRLHDFALERFFARWEFAADLLLCASDIEGWPLHDLLDLADEDGRRRWQELRLGYTESQGDTALRAEIAALYERVS